MDLSTGDSGKVAVSSEGGMSQRMQILMVAVAMWVVCLVRLSILVMEKPMPPALFWTLDMAYFVGCTAIALILLARMGERPWAILMAPHGNIRWADAVTPRAKGLMLAVILAVVIFVFLKLAAPFLSKLNQWLPLQFSYREIVKASAMPWLVVVYFSVTAAITEELVYRWALGKALLDKPNGNLQFYVLSSVMFGAVHFAAGLQSVVLTGLVGFMLAYVYAHTRLLWPVVLAHLLVDLATFWPS